MRSAARFHFVAFATTRSHDAVPFATQAADPGLNVQ
jgi:hypothetical protein